MSSVFVLITGQLTPEVSKCRFRRHQSRLEWQALAHSTQGLPRAKLEDNWMFTCEDAVHPEQSMELSYRFASSKRHAVFGSA